MRRLAHWMTSRVQAIHKDLEWEVSKKPGGGHSLTITPVARFELLLLVSAVLSKGPKLDGWEYQALRSPESLDVATNVVKARGGRAPVATGVRVSTDDANWIKLTFLVPRSIKIDGGANVVRPQLRMPALRSAT